MKNSRHKHKQAQGISTVSVAIALAISVIMLMGALSGYKYIDQTRVNNDVLLMARLKQNTVRYGQAVGSFNSSNATLANLYALGFFDDQTLTSSGAGASRTIAHQWGGSVTAEAMTIIEAGDGIRFNFSLVPNSICSDLGSRLDAYVTWVQIGNTDEFVKFRNENTNTSKLITECNKSGSNKMMKFTFMK